MDLIFCCAWFFSSCLTKVKCETINIHTSENWGWGVGYFFSVAVLAVRVVQRQWEDCSLGVCGSTPFPSWEWCVGCVDWEGSGYLLGAEQHSFYSISLEQVDWFKGVKFVENLRLCLVILLYCRICFCFFIFQSGSHFGSVPKSPQQLQLGCSQSQELNPGLHT